MNDIARRLLAIRSHPKYFLKYCVYTKDGNDLINPCKPFPYQLDYHQALCEEWHNNNLIIVPKSRQMQVTWIMLSMFLWLGITGTDREIYFRRQVLQDATKLLEDMAYIYDHIPEAIWPKDLLPQPRRNREGSMVIDDEIIFSDINTKFYAVSEGKDKMRGRTPTGVLLDEFDFQEDAEFVWQTIKPSVQGGAKVSIVSTYKPRFGGEDTIFSRIIDDRC